MDKIECTREKTKIYILTAKVNIDAVTGFNISFLAGKEIILSLSEKEKDNSLRATNSFRLF